MEAQLLPGSNSNSDAVFSVGVRVRVVAEEECGEGAVAVAPDVADGAHHVACPEPGQAQRHEDAAQHEYREQKQRLRA